MENQFVKPMALFLCKLREAHDIGCLGTEAAVQHCCCIFLTWMDTDRCLAHTIYLRDSVTKLVDLVAIQSMTEAKAVIRLVWRNIFDTGGDPFGIFEAHVE